MRINSAVVRKLFADTLALQSDRLCLVFSSYARSSTRYSVRHRHCFVRRRFHLRAVLDAAARSTVRQKRKCKEACRSIPMVLYFLQHAFISFWYSGDCGHFVLRGLHADIWRGLVRSAQLRWNLPGSPPCETPCRFSRANPDYFSIETPPGDNAAHDCQNGLQ